MVKRLGLECVEWGIYGGSSGGWVRRKGFYGGKSIGTEIVRRWMGEGFEREGVLWTSTLNLSGR